MFNKFGLGFESIHPSIFQTAFLVWGHSVGTRPVTHWTGCLSVTLPHVGSLSISLWNRLIQWDFLSHCSISTADCPFTVNLELIPGSTMYEVRDAGRNAIPPQVTHSQSTGKLEMLFYEHRRCGIKSQPTRHEATLLSTKQYRNLVLWSQTVLKIHLSLKWVYKWGAHIANAVNIYKTVRSANIMFSVSSPYGWLAGSEAVPKM